MYELYRLGECSWYIDCPAKIGIYQPNEKEVYLIDSGNDKDAGKKIKKILDAQGWTLKGIINTHSHADHIGAAGALAARFQVSAVHLAKGDEEIYYSKENAFPPWIPLAENLPPAVPYTENENYKIINCPGHTPGGVSILFEDDGKKHLFSGDTLFAGSIGRTDFEGGSMPQLSKSLALLADTVPEDTVIYPGHGEPSSIGYEKKHNHYL